MKKSDQQKKITRKTIPQVAILLESSHEISRGMLRGILKYVAIHGPWALHMIAGGASDQRLPDLKEWQGNGIIARIPNQRSADEIVQAKLPTILIDPFDQYLAPGHPLCLYPRVQCNSESVADLAADYLISQGFSNFAIVGDPNNSNWSRWRKEQFISHLKEAGFCCEVYTMPALKDPSNWVLEKAYMCDWLLKLPKPVAIFATNDSRGRQVLTGCLSAGITVPYEVAVLGVNNDILICETSQPPLCSVAINTEQGGYMAAEMLDKLMRAKLPDKYARYEPNAIVRRSSSQLIPVTDRLVIKALEFIRINAGLNIRVSDVAEHTGFSERWLEKRFSQELGRSVVSEIHQVRAETIFNMVTKTTLPFAAIAERSGFASSSHLSVVFRNHFGKTMSNARKKHKPT